MNKISIVTICYNCDSEIERTIKSVLQLDYSDKEYIIIDGGSHDKTIDIINGYKEKIDVIVSEPDKGIYDAMNKGILYATGDWIIFMNAGDTFHSKTCVSDLMKQIDDDTIIAHGDIMRVQYGYSYRVPECKIEEMKYRMAVRHQAAFIRLNYHKQHLYDSTFRSSADYNFFYHAYFEDKVKFQHKPIIIADFDAAGTSNINFRKSFRENRKIWGKEKDLLFIFKQEIMFLLWDILSLKRRFFSPKKIIEIEISNLKKKGIKEIEIHKK